MNQKKRGLGRGLGDLGLTELLSDAHAPSNPTDADSHENATSTPRPSGQFDQQPLLLPIDQLMPGHYQPRKHMDQAALAELADSIRAQGIIQPIIVRRMNDKYEIIAGERRWRAAKLAGLTQVPVVLRDIPDKTVIAMSLIENIQRRDLNAIEEATAINRLLTEFNLTHQEAAEALGKSRTSITNLLRLLNLNSGVRHFLEQGLLEMGHARALLALEGHHQSDAAKQIIDKGLSVRDAEALIRTILHQRTNTLKQTTAATENADNSERLGYLKNQLQTTLKAQVNIQRNPKGKGKIVIHFGDEKQLNALCRMMGEIQ